MMYCQTCKLEYSQGEKFCIKCGEPLVLKLPEREIPDPQPKRICPKCSIPYDVGKKFCKQCGSTLIEIKPVCPNCQALLSLEPNEKFCLVCGAPIPPMGIQVNRKQPSKSLFKSPFTIIMTALGGIIVALTGMVLLYHYRDFKLPYMEKPLQWIESKIWKIPIFPGSLAIARTIKGDAKVFPVDRPLYEESGKLFYQDSRQIAIPTATLKKGEFVNILSVGKKRGGECDRFGVQIKSYEGIFGYVSFYCDIEIHRFNSDEGAWKLLPGKFSYEWEGNPDGPLYDAQVLEEFIKSYRDSKYVPHAKIKMGLNYWAAGGLYENPGQPFINKDSEKSQIYKNLAKDILNEVIAKFPNSDFSKNAYKIINSIERGEKHPYVKQVMKSMGNGLKSGPVVQESKTPSVPTPQIYEAEQAILAGSAKVNNEHSGFSGSGYVDGYGYRGLGSTTTFTVIVPSAGDYKVTLRYANATGAVMTVSIYVNGIKIKQTALLNLQSWDTWSDKVEALRLNAGQNTIAYRYDPGDTGNINIDFISVSQ